MNVRSIFSQSLPLLQRDRIQFCLSFLQHLNILSVSSPTPFSLQDDLPDLLLMDKWHFPLRRRITLRKQCRCDSLSSSLIHFLQTLLHVSSRPLISPRHLQITYFIKTASSFGIGIMRLLRLEELWNKRSQLDRLELIDLESVQDLHISFWGRHRCELCDSRLRTIEDVVEDVALARLLDCPCSNYVHILRLIAIA